MSDSGYFDTFAITGAFSVAMAKASAHMIAFNCALIFLPMCRFLLNKASALSFFRRIGLYDSVPIHRSIGMMITLWSAVHSVLHLWNFVKIDASLFLSITGITGIALLLSVLAIFFTSMFACIRNRCYEVFQYVHILWIPFIVVACFHGAFCAIKRAYNPQCQTTTFWIWLTPGLSLYLLDRMICLIRRIRYGHVVIDRVLVHPSNVFELQLVVGEFSYRPGQFLYLRFPYVSRFQWHPFTITSVSQDSFLSVHIRAIGSWTKKVAVELGINTQQPEVEMVRVPMRSPTVTIDGPYGSICEWFFSFSVVVLIGAGIGQTPFASILKDCWYRKRNGISKCPQKIYFFAIAREAACFEWFHQLLVSLEMQQLQEPFIEISVYLTDTRLAESTIRNLLINDMAGICDAITGLKTPTKFGRADFREIFGEITAKYPTEEIGVIFCGPSKMSKSIEKTSLLFKNVFYQKESF